jgi:2-hydroxychromene-2-carboxylate isomerase
MALRVDYERASETTAPRTFEEATQGKQSREWKIAIREQLQSLEANHTWDVVNKPDAANCIYTKWVFNVKMLPNGQIDKYKARLCARGFTQQYGVDYFNTFAPVVRMESLRILLAHAAIEDLEIHQMDVVSAYLLGELEEGAYLKPPEGLNIPRGKVLKLRKGMPGLKQSGRIWNKKITAFFEEYGLRAIQADHSVFTNQDRSDVVALWVDDLVILVRTAGEMQPLKKALSEAFEMKDLEKARHLLGIQITRNRARRTIAIDQKHYIEELVREYGPRGTADVPAAGI